jgi:hypothetical protein
MSSEAMKYRITIAVDVEMFEREEHTFSDVMNAFREGLRLNHRLAQKVRGLNLMECRLIEPEREKTKLMEVKD